MLLLKLVPTNVNIRRLLIGMLKRMGNYFESLFGNKLQVVIAGVLAFLAGIGFNVESGEHIPYILLCASVAILYLIDLVIGSMAAWKRQEFSSRGFGRTLEKLVVYSMATLGMTAFGVIIAALPCASGVAVPVVFMIASARMFFSWCLILIGFAEFISVTENLSELGFKLPSKFMEYLDKMKKKVWETLPINNGPREDEE